MDHDTVIIVMKSCFIVAIYIRVLVVTFFVSWRLNETNNLRR